MNNNTSSTSLSIQELPAILIHMFARADQPLLAGAQEPLGLFVRYLRRKPGRGLAVIYNVDTLRANGHRPTSNDPHKTVSLTLNEEALLGAHIRFTREQAQQAPLDIQPSGVVSASEIGLSVQAFPADSGLPALASSCDTTPGSSVFLALEQAAQTLLEATNWRLVSAHADPVRYKPGNRCVIRYQLVLDNAEDEDATLRNVTIFGKVYADPAQASTVQALQQQLYAEQCAVGQGAPFLPRPLGIIEHDGLTFNEAIQPARGGEPLRTGTHALRPHIVRERGGEVSAVVLPTEELHLTARVLARLHNSGVRPNEQAARTGAKEAKRARERAALIAGRNPAQAAEVQQLAQTVADLLESAQPDTYWPAHGGFKASQLLFHSSQVFLVDFYGCCLADSALDVGYFLAYLRPSGLWYQRPGMREWFELAADLFTTTYRQTMLSYGINEIDIESILERARLYEAALLFKIATRRVNRLNSPRPQELTAMLSEIATCLSTYARRA